MKKHYKTLIVEDHVSTANGIAGFLDEISNSTGTEFTTRIAYNLVDALTALKTKPSFDLVFLDIKLKPQPEIGMNSGEDLGSEIRKRYPKTLIIVSTIHDEPFYIENIMKNVTPEGFFVKGDLDPKCFVSAIKTVLDDSPYLSKTVVKYVSHKFKTEITINSLDRQLLFEMEKGFTMKEIADNLFFSRSTVTKMKKKLKITLGVEGGSNKDLLDKAREMGFI
ncbi:response regulator [Galbibacter sp.]|uniref:response regulator n=1 Tax=Galbibacter sp. TaxID=2918471 RepID=UPI003A92768B